MGISAKALLRQHPFDNSALQAPLLLARFSVLSWPHTNEIIRRICSTIVSCLASSLNFANPPDSANLDTIPMVECWASQKKSSKYNQKLLLTGTVKECAVKVDYVHALQELQRVVSSLLLTCSPWRSANRRTKPQAFFQQSHAHSLHHARGPHQRNISLHALQQVVVA